MNEDIMTSVIVFVGAVNTVASDYSTGQMMHISQDDH